MSGLVLALAQMGCSGKRTSSDGDDGPSSSGPRQLSHDEAMRASQTNLNKIGIAMHNYDTAFGGNLPMQATTQDGKNQLSWRVALLPYVDDDDVQKLSAQINWSEPWDSPQNKKLLEKMPKIYAPVAGTTRELGMTYYQVFVGPGAAFEAKMPMNLGRNFTDGTSGTILVIEAGEPVPWTKPDDLAFDINKPLPKIGGMFDGTANVLMADGAVRVIPKGYPEKNLKMAITCAAGDPFPGDFLNPHK
jgi:prepilin-type processing-associated H-X9-DG protein